MEERDHDLQHVHENGDQHADEREDDAEREALRLIALAQIRQYPDPVLRMRAREVETFDDELRRLVERMTTLTNGANGAGLAATQVGVLRRVFVFHPGEDRVPVALVNPVLVERSDELDVDEEGCLSLQGVLVPVERHVSVTVAGKDEFGADVRFELEGFPARACQHEIDHLVGVLILDRTTDEARRAALAILRPKPVLDARL
jgi:peptide deformylase